MSKQTSSSITSTHEKLMTGKEEWANIHLGIFSDPNFTPLGLIMRGGHGRDH